MSDKHPAEVLADSQQRTATWDRMADDMLRRIPALEAEVEALRADAAVIRAAERTRDDLGKSGTNYPDIRVLLAFVERAIDAARKAQR